MGPDRLFLPGVSDDEAEKVWADLHARSEKLMGRSYRRDRVYSVTFVHDGIDYEAVVGERCEATEYKHTRSGRRDESRPPRRYRSGNTVLAIFAGDPYLMWQVPEGPSSWANPSMIGRPSRVMLFED